MGETEKPFSCCIAGCPLSFVSADHLEVHRKKHDMCLNLESGTPRTSYIDQTPTPTRLLRSCEEVGLFPDLPQVVNPFDEQFRKATERRIAESSMVSSSSSEDSLHTPQVFPEVQDQPLIPNNRTVLRSLISQEDSPKQESSDNSSQSQQQLKIIIPLTLNLSGGQSVQSQQIGFNVTLPPNGAKENETKVKQQVARPPIPVVPMTTIQKADSSSVSVHPAKRPMLSEKEERNRRFRERNRAAATRSRKKRKEWISEVQQKCSGLSKANHNLQQRVNVLKAEVAKLKQELQLHSSCPVTLKQQEQASLGGMATLVGNQHTSPTVRAPPALGTSPTQQMILLGTNMPVLPASSPTQPQVFVLTRPPPPPAPIQPKRVAILPKTCSPPTRPINTSSTVVTGTFKDDDHKDVLCMVPSPSKSSVITSNNMQTVIVQGPLVSSASKIP